MQSIQARANEWISSLFSFNDKENFFTGGYFNYFKIEGFANEPEVYLRSTDEGLEFGFEATKWDGYMPSPVPGIYKKHSLTWETLKSISTEEQQKLILEKLMKTINTRKRQYKKCQFCHEKVALEHRFDKDTCHTCASDHFGVLY
ncbi:hypothetical protein [Sediminibacillus massiliensis]|uniref:hypothetical protein n=1 Tax=Sediminibacillus massiliensis TaxID=1926277 RepID=UPI00098878CB|nr:hypothetical protein [Sediminibacillus massiliensis]